MRSSARFTFLLYIALVISLLSGCRQEKVPVRPTVVTGITVTYENGPISAKRYYTSSPKMRAILNYLRWIDPYGPPEVDPDKISGSTFSIVLFYSNGQEKLYLQKADNYMLEEGLPWRKIDPNRAMTLGKMMGEMESD